MLFWRNETMSARKILPVIVAVALSCAIGGFVLVKRPATRDVSSRAETARRGATLARSNQAQPLITPAGPAQPEPVIPSETNNSAERTALAQAEPGPRASAKPQLAGAKPAQPQASAKQPLKDPAARTALSFVGADPEAEAYWIGAINY